MDVDAIYVISLNTAEERQKIMKSWYPNVNLEFFIVTRGKNPSQGCFESHQKLFEFAKAKGQNRILVLEDDAFPRFPWDIIVKKTNDALSNLKETKWDILALGYIPRRTSNTNIDSVIRINSAYGSHAYIANLPNIKFDKWNDINFDDYLFTKGKSPYISYGTYDILFEQKFEKSQISNMSSYEFSLKTIPDLLGGLENMRNVSMTCHTHVFFYFLYITLPILLFLNIIIWSATGKTGGSLFTGITFIIIIVCLLLMFLLY